jgi:hypothetical protein
LDSGIASGEFARGPESITAILPVQVLSCVDAGPEDAGSDAGASPLCIDNPSFEGTPQVNAVGLNFDAQRRPASTPSSDTTRPSSLTWIERRSSTRCPLERTDRYLKGTDRAGVPPGTGGSTVQSFTVELSADLPALSDPVSLELGLWSQPAIPDV